MGFEVVSPNPQLLWVRVDNADTLYAGQLVKSSGDGVVPLGAASGEADTSNKGVPFGVVVGTNNKTPVFNSTYKGDYITGVTSQANQLAREWAMVEGLTAKGDPAAMVLLALIDPTTIVKGRIFNAAYGTAISNKRNTTLSTDGLTVTLDTSASADFTPVADLCTLYGVDGANAGLYRMTDNTSKTSLTTDVAFPYDIAASDYFRYAPLRQWGTSYAQFDSESTYIEGGTSAALATNYYILDILALDLSVNGSEFALFRFNADHFSKARA